MQTLPYGLKKPEVDDTGDQVFPALADNITQLDGHTHNGANSPRLSPTTQSILAAAWGASIGNGLYKQTVTLPAGLTFDAVSIEFRLSNGDVIYPTVAKASSTTYDVTINDNTQTLTALYSS